jgi:hypothetical protein
MHSTHPNGHSRIGLFAAILSLGMAYAVRAEAAQAQAQAQAQEGPGSYVMLVFNNPVAGREAEYGPWYDLAHAPEVVGFNDVKSAQRFEAATIRSGLPQHPPRRFMIVYMIESRDIRATFAGFLASSQTEPPPVDKTSTYAVTFRALGAEVAGTEAKSFVGHPVSQYDFVAMYEPLAGRESDFNAWYDNTHLAVMLGLPGVVGARRYVRSAVQRDKTAAVPKYLVIYRIATDDIEALFAELGRRAKDFAESGAVDRSAEQHFTYRAVGPLIEKDPLTDKISVSVIPWPSGRKLSER